MKGENVVYEIVPKNDEKLEELPVTPPKGFGVRHTQIFMLFVSLTSLYTIRSQLSVSMVAMTEHIDQNSTFIINNKNISNSVEFDNKTVNEFINPAENINAVVIGDIICEKEVINKWNVYRTYKWNKKTQEIILFSFFVGYTSVQIPMGYFAQKCGGKIPIMMALAVNGVMSLITPWIPLIGTYGWLLMCINRLITGMTQGAICPSMHTMLGKWAPLSERNRLSTYCYSGPQFGTILIFLIAGVFAGSPSLGWPATFWFCGIMNLVCFALMAWLGSDSPHNHPTISMEEKMFIIQGGCADESAQRLKTPWKHILTSKAVWALMATQAGSVTGFNLVLTQTPTYLSYVLGVEIKKNGLYSSLPYGAMYGSCILCAILADYAVNKKLVSMVNIRRISNTIGMVIAGLFLLAFTYVTSTAAAVSCLIISLMLHSAIHSGFLVNQIDLSPNFAGHLMALGNMIANLTSLIVPVIVSNIVRDDMTNQNRWQIVFLIVFIMQIATNTIFVIFVKAEVQPWNFVDEHGNVVYKEELLNKKNLQGEEVLKK